MECDWFYKLLRHPLFIAFISTCVFGIIVSVVSSSLLNRSWKNRHKAELAERIFYLNKKRETNAWNLHSACKNDDRNSQVENWRLRAEIINEVHAMKQQFAIYFGLKKEPELLKIIGQIHEVWHEVEEELSSYPDCKEVTKGYMQQKTKEASELEGKIIKIFNRAIYR